MPKKKTTTAKKKVPTKKKATRRTKKAGKKTTVRKANKPTADKASKKGKPLSPSELKKMYASRQYLGSAVMDKVGLRIPFEVYLQDPLADERSELAIDEINVTWEPGLSDGPTSARFAVVDYNGDTGTLAPPAVWDEKLGTFTSNEQPLNRKHKHVLQFHQVSVWATSQLRFGFL